MRLRPSSLLIPFVALKPRAWFAIAGLFVVCLFGAATCEARRDAHEADDKFRADSLRHELERARWTERYAEQQRQTAKAQDALDSAIATNLRNTELYRYKTPPTIQSITPTPDSGLSVVQVEGLDHPDTVHSHLAQTLKELDSLLTVVNVTLIPGWNQERAQWAAVVTAERAEKALLADALEAERGRVRDLQLGLKALQKGPSKAVRFARSTKRVAETTGCAALAVVAGQVWVAPLCQIAAEVVGHR